MLAYRPSRLLANWRDSIGRHVRALRRARGWSQAELGDHLGLSQSRLSEIERGTSSLTAKQFLLLLQLFNAAIADFVPAQSTADLELQNAMVRLGATHLQESPNVIPSGALERVHDVVKAALVDGSPRIVAALAPVLVTQGERVNLAKLHADLSIAGLERRLAWVVECTLAALQQLRSDPGTRGRARARAYKRTEVLLHTFLEFAGGLAHRQVAPDVLDATIRSKRTLEDVQRTASTEATRWNIVTSLRPEDFLAALKAADEPVD